MNIDRLMEISRDADKAFGELFPIVSAKTWKSLPLDTQIVLRNCLANVIVRFELIRSDFDDAVWRGHDDGTVKRAVESVRTRTVHTTKPGRPAPTPEEVAAKALAKKGIILETTTEVEVSE